MSQPFRWRNRNYQSDCDNVEDDDFDAFESKRPQLSKTKPKEPVDSDFSASRKVGKSKREDITPSILETGSIWRDIANAFQTVLTAFIVAIEQQYGRSIGTTHRIATSGGDWANGLTVNCITDERKSRSKCSCQFGLRVVWLKKNVVPAVRIDYVTMCVKLTALVSSFSLFFSARKFFRKKNTTRSAEQ